ncbi:tyrosine-type recombinase/integrase [Roseicella frigidaeris]|uniref:Integrase n=1 Tax=Roseicella frigidaeris TaxID=2230885 RepID=A0A327LV63_9PROT|nr:tyrosine-type recombinase/integrase [Roseicella frigidaeris]RAI54549.1 integrase [Roseicella frigidaeris]
MSDPAVLPALPSPLQAAQPAEAYARASLSPATLRAYQSSWQAFLDWCALAGRQALPATPATVAEHLASLAATHSRASLAKRLSAIGQYHRLAGHAFAASHPVIHHTLRGIHRQHGRPARRAAALTTAEIKRLLATCRTRGLADLRDRALLLLGYAGALRRAELVAIAREHLTLTADGLRLLIPRSKTDAAGQGAEIGIPRGQKPETCPVRALEAWLQASACRYGPVFRKVSRWGEVEPAGLHPDAVRQILLRRAAQAGLTVSGQERLSPHGLRAGFITEAYRQGARDEDIMDHTRHRDLRTMRGYVRRARLLTESPVTKLGL